MDFQKVVEEKNRMCDTILEEELACKNCLLSSINNKDAANCNEFVWEHPEEAEKIVMEWAEKNPKKIEGNSGYAVFRCRKCYHELRVSFDIEGGISGEKLDSIAMLECPACGEEGYENWILVGWGLA